MRKDNTSAIYVLDDLGPGVESYLWSGLRNLDEEMRVAVCRALGNVGTARSIPPLEGLAGDPDRDVQRAARDAIDAIKRANRQPKPLFD